MEKSFKNLQTTFFAVIIFVFLTAITSISKLNAQVIEPIHTYLSTPADSSLSVVPVVVIRFLPTTDNINLNSIETGITSTLEDMKNKINIMDKQVKFSLEEGSKYHGYSNSSARPSLGYKVVYYLTIYENIPRSNFQVPWNPGVYRPDYDAILNRINAQYYVEQLGVQEFWLWGYHHGNIEPTESNMSSALTGDISNSERRNDDLPIYNKTYVVYNYNFGRTQAEAVHNHGHQLEAILSYIDNRQSNNTVLFWNKFVGKQNNVFVTGRCGWTHMPPNTVTDYDYQNFTIVQSDIEDWTPNRTGQLRNVNANTWGSINYEWPFNIIPSQQIESHWYIYWFQNMPGFENLIYYNQENYITNWWGFTSNWDSCIINDIGLYGIKSGINQINNFTPKRFFLSQNYPNPFNPVTKIKFDIVNAGLVKLKIYDMLGNEVSTLVKENLSQGSYESEFDGSRLSSGVYFYRIETENYSEVKRMMLIK